MIVDHYSQLTERFTDDAIWGLGYRLNRISNSRSINRDRFAQLEEQLDIMCFNEYGKAIKAEMLAYKPHTNVSP